MKSLFTFFVLTLVAVSSSFAQSTTLPSNIRTALDAVAAFRGPMTVRWTDQLSPGGPDAPPEATKYPVAFKPQDLAVTWQDGSIYFYSKLNWGSVGEFVFDRKTIEFGHPSRPIPGKRPTEPSIKRVDLADAKELRWVVNPEFLTDIGIRLPLRVAGLRRDTLQSEITAMLQDGAKLVSVSDATVDGRKLIEVVLQAPDPDHEQGMKLDPAKFREGAKRTLMTKAQVEEQIAILEKKRGLPAVRDYAFYLDPATNGTVRRREERYGQRVLQRTDNDNFRQCGKGGLWIPMKSVTQYFTLDDLPGRFFEHPIRIRTTTVTELSAKAVPKEKFTLNYQKPNIR